MDYSTLNFFLFTLGALAAILNPVGVLPQFLSFTSSLSSDELRLATRRAVITAGGILVAVGIIGSMVLRFFNITIEAFKIAGGIILFKIAFDMLHVRMLRFTTSAREFVESIEKEDVSIFPLAIPLIAGPGSITTVIVLGDLARSIYEYLFLIVCIIFVVSILYIVLLQGTRINKWLGQIGINVMTRLMGLILSAIAVQFILDGLSQSINDYLKFNIAVSSSNLK